LPEPTDDPEQFKIAFADVVRDLSSQGRNDPEFTMLLGSLAAELIEGSGKKHWSGFKQILEPAARDSLRKSLKAQARNMAEAGHTKPVYAARILGVSLIAENLRSDKEILNGIDLLDGIIDGTIRDYGKRLSDIAASKGPLH
jgi:hypothetical protein